MEKQIIEVPILGMDCAECTRHVQEAITGLQRVESVVVYLGAEKAVVRLDPALVGIPEIRKAVEGAGYSIPSGDSLRLARSDKSESNQAARSSLGLDRFTRPVFTLLGVLFGVILFVVVAGEWLGLFEAITGLIPWPVWLAAVLVMGWPIYINVLRAAWRGKVLAHTLMTVGVIAACLVGEWPTAVVVAFFMRVGQHIRQYSMQDQVLVASFHQDAMDAFRKTCPEVSTSITQNEVIDFFVRHTLGLAGSYSPSGQAVQAPEYRSGLHVLTDGFVKNSQRRGMDVHAWTINEVEDMQRLIALGVDAIITDYPDRLLAVLNRSSETP